MILDHFVERGLEPSGSQIFYSNDNLSESSSKISDGNGSSLIIAGSAIGSYAE